MTLDRRRIAPFLLLSLVGAVAVGCETASGDVADGPHVAGGSDLERGRYLVVIGGCNDCHTDGFLQTEGDVPEEQWLMGSPMGWRGPWGTTYARNLRLTVQSLGEDEWVALLKTRNALPPMPWMNINQMAETDMRMLYRYIQSLGPGGEKMPMPVPPDQEPTTPWLNMSPTFPGQ
ncbi:MAG: cytochrome C [Gemmatimonadota bacterium]|nr:MAG: cytochrome C [Gemmatimonadota bacterium]